MVNIAMCMVTTDAKLGNGIAMACRKLIFAGKAALCRGSETLFLLGVDVRPLHYCELFQKVVHDSGILRERAPNRSTLRGSPSASFVPLARLASKRPAP